MPRVTVPDDRRGYGSDARWVQARQAMVVTRAALQLFAVSATVYIQQATPAAQRGLALSAYPSPPVMTAGNPVRSVKLIFQSAECMII